MRKSSRSLRQVEQELADVHLQWADDRVLLEQARQERDALREKYLDVVEDCQFQDRRFHELLAAIGKPISREK
jgi:hypothetical protein